MESRWGIIETHIRVKSEMGWSEVQYGKLQQFGVFKYVLSVRAEYPNMKTMSHKTPKLSQSRYIVWISPNFTGEGEATENGERSLYYKCVSGRCGTKSGPYGNVDFRKESNLRAYIWTFLTTIAGPVVARTAIETLRDPSSYSNWLRFIS